MPKRSPMLSKDATQLFMALEVAAQFRLHYMRLAQGNHGPRWLESKCNRLPLYQAAASLGPWWGWRHFIKTSK